MPTSSRQGMLTGFIVGFVGALGFAVVISFFPESWFVETGPRIVLYAAQVAAGPLFVLLGRGIGQRIDVDGHSVLMWIVAGALTFDGLFIGFWPAVYGQEGFALTMTASLLLWAFAWVVIAGLIMNRDRRAN